MISQEQVLKLLKDSYQDKSMLYLKFTSQKEFADCIINGDLYMNTVQFYRNYEEKQKQRGLGDKYEARQPINFDTLKLTNESKKGDSIDMQNVRGVFEWKSDSIIPMYCMMNITIDELKVDSIMENRVNMKIDLEKIGLDMMSNDFGNYVSIIYPELFREKLLNRAKEDNINLRLDKVTYCEENNEERVEAFFNCSPKRFFYKDLFFEYQKEVRVVIGKDIRQNNNTYRIGDLSEICTNLETVELENARFTIDFKI